MLPNLVFFCLSKGARVILACRDETKAKQACQKIIDETKSSKVEVELLDLGKLKSIKEFSERIKAKLDRLDILINNAGIIKVNEDCGYSREGVLREEFYRNGKYHDVVYWGLLRSEYLPDTEV